MYLIVDINLIALKRLSIKIYKNFAFFKLFTIQLINAYMEQYNGLSSEISHPGNV